MSKVNLMAPVGTVGYGVVGFNVLRTLKEREWDIYLFARGGSERSAADQQMIQFASAESAYFDHNAPCLNIWHQHDLAQRVGYGKYVAWPIFELDTFNEREKHHLSYPQELIVCSEWAKQVILDNEIEAGPITVVPLGIDTSIFNARTKAPPMKPTIFMNAGKWEIRKGHDVLLEMFEEAFNVEDNVELWLLPHNPFLTPSDRGNWEAMYLESPMGKANKIKILPWQKTQQGVASLMARADCGVFPSRAEGWNLEALEMMALGKQVIITNYSAHTEFCTEWNSKLVEVTNKEPAYDGKWFFEQGDWAEIGDVQKTDFANHMREFHELKQSDGEIRNTWGIQTGQEYTWDHSVDLLEKVLDNS